jgi:hypothetical protein
LAATAVTEGLTCVTAVRPFACQKRTLASSIESGGQTVRIVLNIIGVILAFFGTVWILQGTGILTQGGFMVGNIRWAIIGAIVLLIAIAILISINRKRSKAA